MLEAKVKSTYRYSQVMAFGGLEFIKGDWRPLPSKLGKEIAEAHPALDVREVKAEVKPEDEAEAKAKAKAEAKAKAKIEAKAAAKASAIPSGAPRSGAK